MSYILDALDKAEQDRQHKKAPNLKTAHSVVIKHDGIHTGLWITMLMLITLVLVLIVYQSRDFIWSTERMQTLVATKIKTTAPYAPGSFVSAGDLNKGSLAPPDIEVPEESRSIPLQTPSKMTIPDLTNNSTQQLPVVTEITEILSINDLPQSVQRQIPDLTFSTHIYASDPAWRIVGINGKSRKEGDNIEDDLILQEITDQGVVLGFKGYSFTMSVLRNWSSQ